MASIPSRNKQPNEPEKISDNLDYALPPRNQVPVSDLEQSPSGNQDKTVAGYSLSGFRPKEDFWPKMDKEFFEILRESKHGFKIKTIANIAVIAIGLILIANALVYTWMKGTDAWSLFSGGIGVASLIAIFFYKSQDAISKAVANLSVVDMVFKSHYRAYESITDYDYKADNPDKYTVRRDINDLKTMLELLERTTQKHVELIEQIQLVESAADKEETETSEPSSTGPTTTPVTGPTTTPGKGKQTTTSKQ
jgi:hypothetical protein